SLGEGVVGEDESLAGGKVVFLLDPVKHFARGLLREGQEQNLFSRHAVLPQSAVALDQHPRLPGARTGHDQERPSGVVHRCPLGPREGGGTRDHPHDCRATPRFWEARIRCYAWIPPCSTRKIAARSRMLFGRSLRSAAVISA